MYKFDLKKIINLTNKKNIEETKIKNKNKLKGSGIFVVVISSITFSIYAMSVYSDQEHFSTMQKKYEDNIVKEYEKYNDDVESFYQETLKKNQNNDVINNRLNLR